MRDHEPESLTIKGKDWELFAASWTVRDLDDGYVVGNIYFDPDATTRAYMATNGTNWSFYAELEDAMIWCSEHPRPRPRPIVLAERDAVFSPPVP